MVTDVSKYPSAFAFSVWQSKGNFLGLFDIWGGEIRIIRNVCDYLPDETM